MKKNFMPLILSIALAFGVFAADSAPNAMGVKEDRALESHSRSVSQEECTDYLFVYFPYTAYQDERIYFATSRDGLNFTALNDGKFVLESTLGTHGLRDPFIIRSHDGKKFYLLATDLTVSGVTQDGVKYPGMGWSENQRNGSKSIMVWESTDLVNWSDQRMCRVAIDTAGCTWAPEAYYDEAGEQYVVFWASKVSDDDYAKQRIYYTTTKDFVTFSESKAWIDEEWSVIDTTVIKAGEYYYRYTKNESDTQNAHGTPTKRIYCERSTSLLGEWELVNGNSLPVSGGQIEGPTIFKFNSDDAENLRQKAALAGVTLTGNDLYGLYPDKTGRTIIPGVTDDIASGLFQCLGQRSSLTAEDGTGIYQMPTPIASHGTIIPITSTEYDALQNKWGKGADQPANGNQTGKPVTDIPIAENQPAVGQTVKKLKVSGKSKITLDLSRKSKKSVTLKATATGLSGKITWKITKGKKYIKLSKTKGKIVKVIAKKKGNATLQISCGKKKVIKKIQVKKSKVKKRKTKK